MLTSKQTVCEYLEDKAMKVVLDRQKTLDLCNYCYKQYNIPRGLTTDFIAMRKSFDEASEFMLFVFMDGFSQVLSGLRKGIKGFFTESEIKTYSQARYEEDRIKFPLEFAMIQIAPDQWIGRISVDELMQLRKAQLINYNENAQRTMQKIIRGDKEYYKISINKKAIQDIKESLEEHTFISNTLTLNIPEDSEAEFRYDESTKTFIINSIESFDIIDGYHRYISLSQAKDLDPEFSYEMELRIVNFSEEKAKLFIYQEDQKTKMSRINVRTYNVLNAGNRVCERLNTNPRSNIQGLIGIKGIISYGELASLIDFFYFKDTGVKEKENVNIIQVTNELMEDFNMLTEYNTKYLETQYDFKTILGVMYVFSEYRDKDKADMCETVDRVVEGLKKVVNKKFYNKVPRKTLVNEVEKVMKGVE